MNTKLQDLYKQIERCELVIERKELELRNWEIEKQKIRKEIEKMEGKR